MIVHHFAATAASKGLTVAAGLTDSDLSKLKVSPNFDYFPFMKLIQDLVGGL